MGLKALNCSALLPPLARWGWNRLYNPCQPAPDTCKSTCEATQRFVVAPPFFFFNYFETPLSPFWGPFPSNINWGNAFWRLLWQYKMDETWTKITFMNMWIFCVPSNIILMNIISSKKVSGNGHCSFCWKGWKHIKVIHAELCRASTNLILNYFLFVDIWHVLVLVAAPKMVFCQGYSTCPGWDIIQLSQTNILQKEMHFFIDFQYRWDSKWSNQAFNCGERLHHTALHLLNKTCHRSMQELRHAMSCWNSNGLLNVATQ